LQASALLVQKPKALRQRQHSAFGSGLRLLNQSIEDEAGGNGKERPLTVPRQVNRCLRKRCIRQT
jgi:hypothetical protein